MPTETLHFENARIAQQLYNNDPRNLQAVEHQLGVKATSREGWIKLEGEAGALDRAKHLFLMLEESINTGTPVRQRDFAQALAFTNRIGAIAEEEGHHPDIYLSWGKVGVKIWTHKVDGLTRADFVLAAKMDR